MKGIKFTQLKDDYLGIKYDDRYKNFTELYNKTNQSYRVLIKHKIIEPVSIFKGRINQIYRRNDRDYIFWGGYSRGRFGEIGHGGLSGVRPWKWKARWPSPMWSRRPWNGRIKRK